MARINTAQLIDNATTFYNRSNQVRKDPAVQKAWREFTGDVVRAAKSLSKAAFETRSAWRRADTGGADLTPRYA